jgi:hypothetical protein
MTGANTNGLYVDITGANANGLYMTMTGANANGLYVDMTGTGASGISVYANSLIGGTCAYFSSNSSSTSSRSLCSIVNDHTAATGCRCLTLQNDATAGAAMNITGTGVLGIDFTALTVADCIFNCTAGQGCTAAPQTNAPTGFINIQVAGTAQWLPYYNAT